jgi:hypothetical protein
MLATATDFEAYGLRSCIANQSKDASDGLLVLDGGEPASVVTTRVTAKIPPSKRDSNHRHGLSSPQAILNNSGCRRKIPPY